MPAIQFTTGARGLSVAEQQAVKQRAREIGARVSAGPGFLVVNTRINITEGQLRNFLTTGEATGRLEAILTGIERGEAQQAPEPVASFERPEVLQAVVEQPFTPAPPAQLEAARRVVPASFERESVIASALPSSPTPTIGQQPRQFLLGGETGAVRARELEPFFGPRLGPTLFEDKTTTQLFREARLGASALFEPQEERKVFQTFLIDVPAEGGEAPDFGISFAPGVARTETIEREVATGFEFIPTTSGQLVRGGLGVAETFAVIPDVIAETTRSGQKSFTQTFDPKTFPERLFETGGEIQRRAEERIAAPPSFGVQPGIRFLPEGIDRPIVEERALEKFVTGVGIVALPLGVKGIKGLKPFRPKITTTLELGEITTDPTFGFKRIESRAVSIVKGQEKAIVSDIKGIISPPKGKLTFGISEVDVKLPTTQALTVATKASEAGVNVFGQRVSFGLSRVFRTKGQPYDVASKAIGKSTQDTQRSLAITLTEKGDPGIAGSILLKERPPAIPFTRGGVGQRQIGTSVENQLAASQKAIESEIQRSIPRTTGRPIAATTISGRIRTDAFRQFAPQLFEEDVIVSRKTASVILQKPGLGFETVLGTGQTLNFKNLFSNIEKGSTASGLSVSLLPSFRQESVLRSQAAQTQKQSQRSFSRLADISFIEQPVSARLGPPVFFPTFAEDKKKYRQAFPQQFKFGVRLFKFPRARRAFGV